MDQAGAIALLYRRAGFGATRGELSNAVPSGYQKTLELLLQGLTRPDLAGEAVPNPQLTRPPFEVPPASASLAQRKAFNQRLTEESLELRLWWVQRMLVTSAPAREKLTFFMHCHFPTAISKVRFPFYMYRQNQLFRSLGAGDFRTLTLAVATDPAMLIWLDAATDRLPDPNENFARELLERFTMGVGNYTESDVRSAAFAFTGWHLDNKTGQFAINQKGHRPSGLPFLGHPTLTTGKQVIDIVTSTEASARFVTASLWSRFAFPVKQDDPLVIELANAYSSDRSVDRLLGMIFQHPAFVSSQTANGLIKQPTEYVIGALRALSINSAALANRKLGLFATMSSLGQVLFDPPSVGGWPQNEYWLSTAAALARWRFAVRAALVGDISYVADAPVASRADAAAELLSVTSWSTNTLGVLKRVAGNPHNLVAYALVSPEYVSN